MGELLENGSIRFFVDDWDEEHGIVGTGVKDYPPADPHYEYLINWLPPQDRPRARNLLAVAHPEKAVI